MHRSPGGKAGASWCLRAAFVLGFFCVSTAALLAAGPVDFGKSELDRAFLARGLKPITVLATIVSGRAESFAIQPGRPARITGGDKRGLMYGFLEAAEQIRRQGRLSPANGSPRTQMRGILYFINNQDLEEDWYYSQDYWDEYFRMLAYDRFNRFNLVFACQTNYLAPPYPFWVDLPGFPEIRVPRLTPAQRNRNLQMLQYISQAAADYGIDFTLGIWQQNAWPSQKPTVEGITQENLGPYVHAALKKVLQLCPAIRSVQIRANVESGISPGEQVKFYNDYFFPAVRDCGRPVTLDLRVFTPQVGLLGPTMVEAMAKAGYPLRVSSKYWAEFVGRPYQPAETVPTYSYLNLLEKPRPYAFYWELWGVGSNQLLLWGNPDYVRRAVSTFGLGDAVGFEIDPPLAYKGFGNRPGKWGIFTEHQKQRVFWKWEYERYWLFYMLWGRLSYDPQTPDSVWQGELQRRFGPAAGEVLKTYVQSSGVINELVAAHLANPNALTRPEFNPGGLIDDYIDVLPSDWRYIASIPEAVQNRIHRVASAKQTPRQTSELLDLIASKTEQAVARAGAKIGTGNKEWASSQPDFEVLALLARYHARKMMAAYELKYFYETDNGAALEAAKAELEKALPIWEKLARLTDGVYPDEMVYGMDGVEHWKDRVPYVHHDLETIAERAAIFKGFGRFAYGFDFGAPVAEPALPSGLSDWPPGVLEKVLASGRTEYVFKNNVERRFLSVDPSTRYQEASGYGWADDGRREAVGIPLTPYSEVRSAAKDPKSLPRDVLFRDYIRGEGPQRFRVKAPPGEYTILFLRPDRTTTSVRLQTQGDSLFIPFPEGPWAVSGLVIQGSGATTAPARAGEPKFLPRPQLSHVAPKTAEAGKPLALTLRISPISEISAVRLHYRAVNQSVEFKTLEAGPAQEAKFTIPGTDISAKWDLMYYFEVLNKDKGGWFEPDPSVATPYHVVRVKTATGSGD